jgi:hypothetical protein
MYSADALNPTTSTLLGTASRTSDSATSVLSAKLKISQPTVFADEKEMPKEAPMKKKQIVYVVLD